MNPLLRTLIFYSLMRRSVTMMQLARLHHMSVLDIQKWLEKEHEMVYRERGEYRLKGSENIASCVAREAVKKRFDFVVKLAQYNPFIKGVALANSWTFDASKKTSDVDVVIICKKNRLYITRLLFVLPLKVLQLRPKETEHMPICASFFIDEEEDMSKRMFSDDDVYFVYWVSNLYCVGDTIIWERVLSSMKRKLVSWSLYLPIVQKEMQSHLKHKVIQMITRLWADNNVIEYIAYRLQGWYLPAALREDSAGVTISRTVFKAHTDDKRELLIKKFSEVCQKYNNDILPIVRQ